MWMARAAARGHAIERADPWQRQLTAVGDQPPIRIIEARPALIIDLQVELILVDISVVAPAQQ